MAHPYYISSFCHIKEGKVFLNGKTVFESESDEFPTFIKSVYRNFKIEYSKFFKMDHLSKLAFMAAEILLKTDIEYKGEQRNIALVFCNRASSLDTDRQHQRSIKDKDDFYPSPAIFVYTLPNICMGEISIRHKLYSENSFFIFDDFNAPYLYDYSNSLLDDGKAEKVLCGWVDFDDGKYEAFLYLTEKSGAIEHRIEVIKRLYQEPWKT